MNSITAIALFVVVASAQDQPPLPPFLEGASDDTLDSFENLMESSDDKTPDQLQSAMDAWANSHADVKAKYAAFKAKLGSLSDARQKHDSMTAGLSPAAKEVDGKIYGIIMSPSLTGAQKRQQIEAILNGLSPAVKAELENMMKQG
ncbi:hypothetical protein AB6A40_004837 [Gnathostoma spinigerum]|uniref:SXP/RAL-2 family protein Ani s 5-like cation-binding domain-containing protein n=1 Tax=Gnathostoma spinigerum TaxID=75299 RepID=A0ABD6EDP5_9BILA